MEFSPYPKTPRLKRDIVITEKLDGTNAQVVIQQASTEHGSEADRAQRRLMVAELGGFRIFAGSRSRWITPGKLTDNYGFAAWVQENAEELFKLGEGQHFGEWYGQGIQRGYGLDHRRFALFNTARWTMNPNRPACCNTVPVLAYTSLDEVDEAINELVEYGSKAAPYFFSPEGIIVYHTASKQNFKVLLDNDHQPKGLAA